MTPATLAIFLQDSAPATGLGWETIVFFALVAIAIGYVVRTRYRRRKAFEAWTVERGFTFLGPTLPPTLKPPSNVWLPSYKISECYSGTFHSFDVVIFQTRFPQGESVTVRSMLAVRRPPMYTVSLNDFMTRLVTLDTTSTPGWVIASTAGGSFRIPVLEVLLKALTAPDTSAA